MKRNHYWANFTAGTKNRVRNLHSHYESLATVKSSLFHLYDAALIGLATSLACNTMLKRMENFSTIGKVEKRSENRRRATTYDNVQAVQDYLRTHPVKSVSRANLIWPSFSLRFTGNRKNDSYASIKLDTSSSITYSRLCSTKSFRYLDHRKFFAVSKCFWLHRFSDDSYCHLSEIPNTLNSCIWGAANPRDYRQH